MSTVPTVWVIHVVCVAWMACKHLEHSIVGELDWIKSMLIMLKICSRPMLPKEAFMPRLVSVFNWQPLHLVNYLAYCVREKGKRTKAFVLWIAVNKGIKQKKAEHPATEYQLTRSLPVCRQFLEWLSLGEWKWLKRTLYFKTQIQTFVFMITQRTHSEVVLLPFCSFCCKYKGKKNEIGNENILNFTVS